MRLVKISLLITLVSISSFVFGQARSKQEILSSIGSTIKWNDANYILFQSTSPQPVFKEHSFLMDKQTGKVRFEGKTNNNTQFIVLFNYKTKILEKYSTKGAKETLPFAAILDHFFNESELLFLPMWVISSNKDNVEILPSRIKNGVKLSEIAFKNIYNLDKKILNGLLISTIDGEIKEYQLNNVDFIVGDTKDIGDGIILPTSFYCKDNPSTSIKFNTVAAFTDIEITKFSKL